jgi:hypothetical protein
MGVMTIHLQSWPGSAGPIFRLSSSSVRLLFKDSQNGIYEGVDPTGMQPFAFSKLRFTLCRSNGSIAR